MPFSLNLTVNIKFVSLLCFEQMFTHLCLQKNIINVHHISSLLILTIWSKALYLLLWAEIHEGCVVEEVGYSWCVYVSIPETNFERRKCERYTTSPTNQHVKRSPTWSNNPKNESEKRGIIDTCVVCPFLRETFCWRARRLIQELDQSCHLVFALQWEASAWSPSVLDQPSC